MAEVAGAFQGVIFDLDNTLYSKDTGLFSAIDARINLFIQERLGLSGEQAVLLRRRYRDSHHITLCGLIAEHGISPEEYLRFVHAVPVEEMLSPDPALDGLLGSLTCSKHIFTNGSLDHARRVTRTLGVQRHFTGIFDIAFTGFIPKPLAAAFTLVLEAAGLDAGGAIYVDDLPRNLEIAGRLGMTTILLDERGNGGKGVSYTVRNLGDLGIVLGGFFPIK